MNQDEIKIQDIVHIFGFGEVCEVAKFLEENRSFNVNDFLFGSDSAFGISVRFSNYSVVKHLLKSCADVNKYFPDKGGDPVVKLALDQKDIEMVNILKAHNPDLSAPGWMGISYNDRLDQ